MDSRADEEASASLTSAVLESLPGQSAVLDRRGTIIAVNRAWRALAEHAGADPNGAACVGQSYLAVCRRAASDGDRIAQQALDAIIAVLDGNVAATTLEYDCATSDGRHWYELRVEALGWKDGGALVMHLDARARKAAEDALDEQRNALAHMTRVATIGEMTAFLAHEIRQPLAAILGNAYAACRILGDDADPQLREIVDDIIDDTSRAGHIIDRVRKLVRKSDPTSELVDVNALVREVLRLTSAQAGAHGIVVAADLDEHTPRVFGDPVMLRQAVLNPVLNAFEAIGSTESSLSRVTVGTRSLEATDACDARVEVTIRDTGPGFPPGALATAFEPFHTTKPSALGLGLSISRSVFERHGGRVTADNHPEAGAIVRIVLPASAG
jgi:signal transduction histidine kinase